MLRRGLFSALVGISTMLMGTHSAFGRVPPQFHHVHGGLVNDIYFLDSQRGWTAEDGGRIRFTTNGGVSWQNADVAQEYRGDLFGIVVREDALGDLIGFAVGDFGTVLASNVTGTAWTVVNDTITDSYQVQQPNQQVACGTHPAKLQGIFMKDELSGYCVGVDGAFAVTTNGWQTWSQPSSINLPAVFDCDQFPLDIYKIHFFYEASPASGHTHWEKGIMLSEYGYTFVTQDSGANWTLSQAYPDYPEIICPPAGGNVELWSMTFSNPLEPTGSWWVCGGNGFIKGFIFRTDDQGATWHQESDFQLLTTSGGGLRTPVVDMPTFYGITLLGSSEPKAMCVGYGALAFTKEDQVGPNFDPCTLTQISGSTSNNVWVQQETKAQSLSVDEDPAYLAVAKTGTSSAVLGGAFGRIQTFDVNATPQFQDRTTKSHNRLRDGAFVKDQNFDHGVACGQGYTVWTTSNAGDDWTSAVTWTLDSSNWAMGIDVSSSGVHGACVGTAGFVAHGVYSSGIWTWTRLTSANQAIPTNLPDLIAVAFVPGSLTAYAVGSVGRVLKTTDGGATWSNLRQAGTENLHGVSFITASRGFVTGAGGKVFQTNDGGTTWTQVALAGNPAPTTTLFDIAAWDDSNANAAIVVGAGGTVYKKSGAASTFSPVSISFANGEAPLVEDLFDVEVLNSGQSVRIGGSLGRALFYDNSTWTPVKSGTTFPLFRMCFNDINEGFAFGSMFVVARYD